MRNLIVCGVFFGIIVVFPCHAVEFTSKTDRIIPTFDLNLDLPPEERWGHIVRKYRQYYPAILNFTQEFIPKLLEPLAWKFAGYADRLFDEEYATELRGISKELDIPLGELVLINTIYDLTAFDRSKILFGCTSIIAETTNGTILHGRNLDYAFRGLLDDMAIMVNFMKGGKVQYTGITFVFYIGVLTGQRPNAFSISLDERYDGSLLDNILMIIYTRFHNPTTFVLRKALETKNSFREALLYLSSIRLMAPSYIILGGVRKGEGVVLARKRWNPHDIWHLSNNSWYLVETNFDRDQPPMHLRKKTAMKALDKVGQKNITPETMFNTLSTNPVLNSGTIYSVVMSAVKPEILANWAFIRN